jgi:tetratricopeptide (TPR) repeat protein
LEIALSATPAFSVPQEASSKFIFGNGYGGVINADLCFLQHFGVGPEFGYMINQVNNDTVANTALAGGSVSAWAYPASRMVIRAQGSFGGYIYNWVDSESARYTYTDYWWKAWAEAGFRFSPSFSVGAGAGYLKLMAPELDGSLLYSGVTAGVTVRVTIDTATSEGNVSVKFDQYESVFPAFAGMYKQNSIGTLRITNRESAEIRNLTVSFRAGNYTSSLLSSGEIAFLSKRKSKELPLYADFSPTILNFTENGKIPGELVIAYDLLGVRKEISKTLVIDVYNRNTLRWTDNGVLAAFIAPMAPEVLDYSKFVVGVARDSLRSGLNRNMQFAAYLLEGLKVGGVKYSHDETTPYARFHLDPSKIDFVQYPFQTLAYRSGDIDDLGILYAASLESVGIKTAIIPLKDDFIVAFALGLGPDEAADLFNSTDSLLTIGDELWIPVSMSVLREGFMNSWYNAIKNLGEAMADESATVDFIVLSDAWQTYPPAAFKNSEARFDKPDEGALTAAVETDMLRYISQEFGPKIRALKEDIRATGGSAKKYNALGTLYVRAGMYEEAKKEYSRSAGTGSVPAMVNLGNIAILEREPASAVSWFRKALEIEPDNKGAKAGFDRASADLED